MPVNLIVPVLSLLLAGNLAPWIASPALRPALERPNHRFLRQQRRFAAVTWASRP
jgi:hypothetical protein